jgi:hypothetical protein
MLSTKLNSLFGLSLTRIARATQTLNIRPFTIVVIALILAVGAALSLALERWSISLFFVLLAVVLRKIAHAQYTHKKPSNFELYFYKVTAVYTEFLIVLGLAIPFPLLAFLAFSVAMVAEYSRSRVLLIIKKKQLPFPSFGDRADRVGLIIASLLVVYLGGKINSLYGFTAAHDPTWFGLAIPEFFLYIVVGVSIVAALRNFWTGKKSIERAIQKKQLQEYVG